MKNKNYCELIIKYIKGNKIVKIERIMYRKDIITDSIYQTGELRILPDDNMIHYAGQLMTKEDMKYIEYR